VHATERDEDGGPVWTCTPGTELPGGFIARERLAVGRCCETWLVWSVPLWAPAVLKLARPHQAGHPGAARRLGREVMSLRGNEHPSLPRLFRDGTTASIPHVAMEYIDGPGLGEELAIGGPLDEAEAALLGSQLLTGLLALHRRGVVHVALRPDAVVLRDVRPVLVDFGSARRVGATQPTRHPAGNPGYAAPELEAGDPIDPAMDLYSLGAILHEARTGAPTFDPAVRAADRSPPRPLCPTPFGELVSALLEPEPAKRPAPAEVLATLADVVPDDLRPWPAWLDGHLEVTERPEWTSF
jgi:eukaryotic-like serine/threonine-protein kinase